MNSEKGASTVREERNPLLSLARVPQYSTWCVGVRVSARVRVGVIYTFSGHSMMHSEISSRQLDLILGVAMMLLVRE